MEALLIQQYQVSFTAVSATLVLIPVFKLLHKHKRHVYFGFQVKWITDHLQTFTEIHTTIKCLNHSAIKVYLGKINSRNYYSDQITLILKNLWLHK